MPTIPGTLEQFSLEKYQDLGKPYARLTLLLLPVNEEDEGTLSGMKDSDEKNTSEDNDGQQSVDTSLEVSRWSTRSSTVLVFRSSLLSSVLSVVVLLVSCAKMPILLTILPTTPNVTRWSEVR